MSREKPFKTEAELCAAFVAWAKREGFTVYPETDGWDLLLVTSDGLQLGVEAKLTLNLKVIDQVLKESTWMETRGPDFRGVLVPERVLAAEEILARCGVEIFVPQWSQYDRRTGETTWNFHRQYARPLEMFDWNPIQRCVLPDYVPDVPAGVPSPVTLSPWKVGALRVLALLESKGWVNRDEVRACKNDPRRWCASDGWLKPLGNGKWGPGRAPRFDQQHPEVYAQILAETKAKISEAA